RGEIERVQRDARVRSACPDRRERGLPLLDVPHGEDDRGAVLGECARGFEPEPGVGAGDDRAAAGEVGDVRFGPVLAHGSCLPGALRMPRGLGTDGYLLSNHWSLVKEPPTLLSVGKTGRASAAIACSWQRARRPEHKLERREA